MLDWDWTAFGVCERNFGGVEGRSGGGLGEAWWWWAEQDREEAKKKEKKKIVISVEKVKSKC